MINSFSEKYFFLSNFYPSKIEFDGRIYPTVEHAFQAAKTLNKKERQLIQMEFSPAGAKRLGRNVLLRSDWEDIKISIMQELVTKKFQDESLKEKLLQTYNEELIEGNHWRDTFWGVCNGVGENHLGKILMKVRNQLRSQE